MKETNVEVEGIKLAVSMFRKTDPKRCREVLLESIRWLKDRYIRLGEKEDLQKALLHIQAYGDLGFPYQDKEFAMESYEIEADQYILKEQMDKRLPGILEKLMYRLGAERNQYRMLRNEDGEQKIYFREMICIHKRKMGKYAEFETFQGTFRERISLDRLLEELDSKEFFLADRSNIINLRNVQSIRDNVICLEEGHTLELNQYRIEAAKKRIEAYWRERIWNEQPTS